jgi:hypothetical protein
MRPNSRVGSKFHFLVVFGNPRLFPLSSFYPLPYF